MVWRESFLDLILIPLSLLLPMLYHAWLYRAVRHHPLSTAFGIYSASRRVWVSGMIKDNDDKKGVLVVQSLRNVIMGSTLMATTAVLFCTGIAAVLSSTYAIKKPLSDAVFGAHGEYMMALNFLINTSALSGDLVTPDFMAEILERGFTLNFVGNRLFYAGVPLLLWIFGPLLAFLSSLVMIPILYNLDVVNGPGSGKGKAASSEHSSGCVNAKADTNGNGNGCMHV
ncbi:unnamed protein product [Alopecurus aequalis]